MNVNSVEEERGEEKHTTINDYIVLHSFYLQLTEGQLRMKGQNIYFTL